MLFFNNLDNFSESYKKYLNANESKILNQASNIVKKLCELICSDNGTTIIKLRSYRVDKCHPQSIRQVDECIGQYMVEFSLVDSFPKLFKKINEHQCKNSRSNLNGIADCIESIFGKCSEFLGSIFETILNVTYEEFRCDMKHN